MRFNFRAIFLVFSIMLVVSLNAQNPLTSNNLTAVKADQITDQQLIEFVSKAKSSGLSEDQMINLATSRGLAPSEVSILKDRIEKLNINARIAPPSANNTDLSSKSAVTETTPVAPPVVGSANEKNAIDPGSVSVPEVNEIYGHRFFKNNSIQTFEKGTDAKASEDYIIGSGDEFAISVFGFSYFNEVAKVDQNGYIKMTNIGLVNVKGLSYAKAKALIRSKLAGSFDLNNNTVTIALSYSRLITINIVGEVDKPGSYKMPAINTAFNALIAVGGPSKLGTVRNIQIRRAGKLIKTLDVYAFLNNPDSKQSYFLQDNDYIVVPTLGKVVHISGPVKRPMSYELLPNENLNELITHAGGLTSKAYKSLVTVSRLNEDGKQRQIQNISLDSLVNYKRVFTLKDGDIITIAEKVDELVSFVELRGTVYRQGKYQFTNGMRVSDLIKLADGLRKEARTDRALLIRLNNDQTKLSINVNLESALKNPKSADDIELYKGDILKISATTDFTDGKQVSIVGNSRKPGTYDYYEGMTLNDLLFMSDGIKGDGNKERAFLVRTKPDFTKDFLVVNLQEAEQKPEDTKANPQLMPGDVISIQSISDKLDKLNIFAIGLFKAPGTFEYVNGITLGDLISLAGGLRLEADLVTIEVSRISFFNPDYKIGDASRVIINSIQMTKGGQLNEEQLKFKLNPYDQVFVRMIPDFELPKNINVIGQVKYPGIYALTSKTDHVDEIIARAGGLNRFADAEGATLFRPELPGGYIVMNLKQALKNHKSRYNLLLKEGDVLTIPTLTDLVFIKGSVDYLSVVGQQQINTPYVAGKRADYYVKEFGNGFTNNSWKRKTYVIESNMKVNRTRNFVLFKIYPKVSKGATIYVVNKPVKEKKVKKESAPIDWNKSISDFTVKLTGLATLYILLRSVGVQF